ncbi:GNAT family N-acetyltransferase [Lacisediminihabitans profunda]|uniref:GNAT family N-acetyltransferase n=1 Tax=Lacisediminihabitans profunda TaxID=2594790 RepID=A0A5C8USB7_9MICO|nr:GNAT family N-acetyltransferase [Lacisediminihabitans profunda]TXN30476.1 GNAT family N-acetyltransferase [Lacisediminihabitans profunda]
MIVRAVDWDDPAAVTLRDAQRREVSARYGSPDSEPGPAPTADDMVVFLVAYDAAGEPVGCGGLRPLGPTEGEIKRMFVTVPHRGTGVATALLAALEDEARGRGWLRLLLETGDRQPEAVRFYEREGYSRIPNFGHYAGSPISLCFAKALVVGDPAADVACEGCE